MVFPKKSTHNYINDGILAFNNLPLAEKEASLGMRANNDPSEGKLRNERELKGEGSIYSSMQPFVRPEISDLMNERIDVLSEFKMLGKEESELRWCQGEVMHVYEKNGCQWFVCVGIQFQIVPAGRVPQNQIKNYYQLDGTRMWLVHGDWTYQLMLRTHLTRRVMEKLAMAMAMAMVMAMAMAMATTTVSVVQLPLVVVVVVARYL